MISSFRNVVKYCRHSSTGTAAAFNITGPLSNENFNVGSYAEVVHTFEQQSVASFAGICGDNNPLHLDKEFASTTIFKQPIVHGILVSSLFSALFGSKIIGSIYVSQSLQFLKPVFVGKSVTARVQVLTLESKKWGTLVTCSTICTLEDGGNAIIGEAKVLVPL